MVQSVSQAPPDADPIFAALRDFADPDFLTDTAAAGPSSDPDSLQIRAGALFARLKAANRAANAASRAHKHATADARLEMDQAHLSLQNLLYEKSHLEREIDKCRDFASIYQDIPMHSFEEWLQLAPEQARTEEVLKDERETMINRLSFELASRQQLAQRKEELKAEREELMKQSKAQTAITDRMQAQIDAVMKSMREAEKSVDEMVPSETAPSDVPFEIIPNEREEDSIATLVPDEPTVPEKLVKQVSV